MQRVFKKVWIFWEKLGKHGDFWERAEGAKIRKRCNIFLGKAPFLMLHNFLKIWTVTYVSYNLYQISTSWSSCINQLWTWQQWQVPVYAFTDPVIDNVWINGDESAVELVWCLFVIAMHAVFRRICSILGCTYSHHFGEGLVWWVYLWLSQSTWYSNI